MIANLCGFFDPIINWIRGLAPGVKITIILVFSAVAFYLFAKSLTTGSKAEKKPIKWLPFGFSLVCMGIAVAFAVI